MSKSQAAQSLTPSEYSLKVLTGPDKGSVYSLTTSQVSIGRSTDNDIVFSGDPKVSRKHVVIDLEGPTPKVKDVSGKNLILVDGEPYREANISSGSQIQIGDVELEFQVISTEAVNLLAEEHHIQEGQLEPIENPWLSPTPAAEPLQEVAAEQEWPVGEADAPPAKKNNRVRFYSIVALIGLLFWFLLTPTGEKKVDRLKIRSSEEILEEAKASKKRQEALLQAKSKKGKNTRQFDEAQASYLRCFRDYSQAQYTRAIQHCQAALSLYPKHTLAERYLLLSKQKRDQKIQYLLRQGRLYRERGYYKICMSTLKTVMYDIRNPKNSIFKEARQLYSECRNLAEDRY